MKTQNCQSNPEGQKNKTKQNRRHNSSRHQTINSIVQHCHTHTRINATARAQKQTQCNSESPEADPRTCSQLSAKEEDYNTRKSLFSEWCWTLHVNQ